MKHATLSTLVLRPPSIPSPVTFPSLAKDMFNFAHVLIPDSLRSKDAPATNLALKRKIANEKQENDLAVTDHQTSLEHSSVLVPVSWFRNNKTSTWQEPLAHDSMYRTRRTRSVSALVCQHPISVVFLRNHANRQNEPNLN